MRTSRPLRTGPAGRTAHAAPRGATCPARLVPALLTVLAAAIAACAQAEPAGTARAGLPDPPPDIEAPRVLDERLEISLFAAEPDIVTPIGLATDERDRVYVLESHTHGEPDDYDGPARDRIQVFADRDGDGAADRVRVFAEGIENGMNIAFSPGGTLFVVTSRSVWALADRDGDGRCGAEERNKVLELEEPRSVYDHAALLGVAFSRDGWMYTSRGNIGGAPWRLAACGEDGDGSRLEGFGDGGEIYRSRLDGSRLEVFATGFWNPFGLAFDPHGRLLVSDNDPDSRGPNRLVHAVRGGDYGYKALYGGSGIHPYLAWNGELPGTLPYAAPLGEAPAGILPARYAALPAGFRDAVLAAIWEESRIVRVDLAPRGASVAGQPELLVDGGHDFRPVALAAGRRGAIYITDWALRQYPNHGRGRIWRLAAKPGVETAEPRPRSAPPLPDRGVDRLGRLGASSRMVDFDRLTEALAAEDPVVRTAAITALARPVFRDGLIDATRSDEAAVRLGALVALERSGADRTTCAPVVRRLLGDPDARVRRRALVCAGRRTLTSLRGDLERAIRTGEVSGRLFATYLATVRHLQPPFVDAYRGRDRDAAEALALPEDLLPSIIADDARPPVLRTTALRHLQRPAAHLERLVRFAGEGPVPLRREAVRSLATIPRPAAAAALRRIAFERTNPAALRADALLALSWQEGGAARDAEALLDLLDDPSPAVRLEAARCLRTRPLDRASKDAAREAYEGMRGDADHEVVAQQLAFALAPVAAARREGRPRDDAAWQAALAEAGDPATGRRVFFSPGAQCSTCHAIDHRGGNVGPDLSGSGASKTRRQLVRALLEPSAEVALAWQTWYVRTADGEVHLGRQIDVHYDDVELYTSDGEFVTFDDVVDYGTAEASLMPDGLEEVLTVSDLRSLLAFLEERR